MDQLRNKNVLFIVVGVLVAGIVGYMLFVQGGPEACVYKEVQSLQVELGGGSNAPLLKMGPTEVTEAVKVVVGLFIKDPSSVTPESTYIAVALKGALEKCGVAYDR